MFIFDIFLLEILLRYRSLSFVIVRYRSLSFVKVAGIVWNVWFHLNCCLTGVLFIHNPPRDNTSSPHQASLPRFFHRFFRFSKFHQLIYANQRLDQSRNPILFDRFNSTIQVNSITSFNLWPARGDLNWINSDSIISPFHLQRHLFQLTERDFLFIYLFIF